MRGPSGFVAGTLLLLAAAAAVPAQESAPGEKERRRYPSGIFWLGNVEAALDEARQRNAPILLAFNEDFAFCDTLVTSLYGDKTIIELSRKFVCLVASRPTHDMIAGRGPDGRKKKVCKRFGSVSCEEHQAVQRWAFLRFSENGQIMVPEHIFLDPAGRVLERFKHQLGTTNEEFGKHMNKALERVGPGLEALDFRRFSRELDAIEKWIGDGHHAKSIKALHAIIARAGRSTVAGRAHRLLERIETALTAELAEVDKLLAAGEFDAARARARKAQATFRGLRSARIFEDRLKLLGRRGGSAADRAQVLLARAEADFAAKRYDRAEAVYVKILKRYGSTPAAELARTRLRNFEKDPELKKALAACKADAECENWLKLADALLKNNRPDQARAYLEKIIRTHPDSPHAAEAKRRLARL
jgi:tetratricopeptide (TPR) repeat protein